MAGRRRIEEYVSPLVKSTKESDEWKALVKRQPVVISGVVSVQFKKQFFSTDWTTLNLELRCTTLVFYDESKGAHEALYSFPLEFTKVDYSDEHHTVTCTYSDKMSFTFVPSASTYKSWRESVLSAAELQAVSLKDFNLIHLIGKGATGAVYLAIEKTTGKRVAIKVMEKNRISDSEKALKRLINERLTLEILGNNPFFLQLHSAFQSEDSLYIVTDYCEGGDLERFVKRRNYSLNAWQIKQLTAEIVISLEYLHKQGIVYRDLKLENILLDSTGHIRLADFGLSKVLQRGDKYALTNSFCGTLGYIAPEVVEGKDYGFDVDFWALGCVLFKLIVGRTPFYAKSRDNYFRAVKTGRILFPDSVSADAQDLIRSLMNSDPSQRPRFADIKKHKFFADVDWNSIVTRTNSNARDMFMTAEHRQMSTDSLLSLEKGRLSHTSKMSSGRGSRDSGSWWEAGLPRVMSSMLLGEKKTPKNPAIPGFLYSMSSTEGLSRGGSVSSAVSVDSR